jgi:hypothetical protein
MQDTPDTDFTLTASPARYIWAGIAIVLSLILLCTLAVAVLGRTAASNQPVPTPAPGSQARIALTSAVAAGSQYSVGGTGFQPGETVELYSTTDPAAPFGQFTLLGTTTAGQDGSWAIGGLTPPANVGKFYLIAKGSSSGFTPFIEVTVTGPAPTTTGVPPATATTGPSGPLPYLVIVSVNIQLQTGNACNYTSNELGIQTTIGNNGAAAPPFVVQVNGQRQTVTNGLLPGQTVSLWFPGYVTGPNTVVVNPDNTIPNANQANNTFSQPLPVPTLPATCTPTATPLTPIPTPTFDPNAVGVWIGTYYNNQDLLGNPVLQRYEPGNPFLSLNFGTGSPGPGVPRDFYSAVFTRIENFTTPDIYAFTLSSATGARLYIDGALVIDQWLVGSTNPRTENRFMAQGQHNLRIEFYKTTGVGYVSLKWQRSGTPGGWLGRYFNNTNFQNPPVLLQDDPCAPIPGQACALDLTSTSGNWPPAGVNPDNFSVRWQRQQVFSAGTYTFTVDVDDVARLFIDGVLVINQNAPGVQQQVRTLSGGQHTLDLEYIEFTGVAKIKVTWDLVPPTPPTPTNTPTTTSTPSITPTPSNTPTSTTTSTPTDTPTPSPTPTITETPTNTPTPTDTSTPTDTPTPSQTPTPTETPTPPTVIATIMVVPTDTPSVIIVPEP